MKKNLIVLLSFATLLLAGCFNSENVVSNEVETETGSVKQENQLEDSFNKQIEETQYIKDINEFLSHDVESILNEKPYVGEYSLNADFDESSSIKGGLTLSLNNYVESKDVKSSDIEFVLNETELGNENPLNTTGSLSLLYQGENMYAKIHNFELYMGEENMSAKMYELLIDLLLDKWVDMEAGEGGIVSVDTEDSKIENTVSNLKSVLKTEDIYSSEFLNSLSELIDTINGSIDLGISTDGLSIASAEEVKFYEVENGVIQKEFIASLKGSKSEFDISFLASKNSLIVRLYNIKNFDETTQSFVDSNGEVMVSIQDNKKSNHDVSLLITQNGYTIADIQGTIDFGKTTKISAKFILQPELLAGQIVSGSLNGNISKRSPKGSEKIPEISGETVKLSDVLGSL